MSFCHLPTLLSCALELGSSYSGHVKRCGSGLHVGAGCKQRLPKKAEPQVSYLGVMFSRSCTRTCIRHLLCIHSG